MLGKTWRLTLHHTRREDISGSGMSLHVILVAILSSSLSALLIVRSTEEMFQMLEDNQVTLSTMKASRYMKAFEKEIDKWERTLSHILEVVEMILQVQRQWMYLEVRFGLGEGGCI